MPEQPSSCTQITLQPISVDAKQTNGKGAGKIIPRGNGASRRKLNLVARYAYSRYCSSRGSSPISDLIIGLTCRDQITKDELPPRYPAWISGKNVQAFDVRQPQGLYAAWDVLRSTKPACLHHAPLIAKLVSKWSPEYLVRALSASNLHPERWHE